MTAGTPGDASSSGSKDKGPSTSSAVSEEASIVHQNVAQGEAQFTDTDIRLAIDSVIEESQRMRFSSIDRDKIIFRSIDTISETEVQKRLQAVLAELLLASKTSDVIKFAMSKTDGIALLA